MTLSPQLGTRSGSPPSGMSGPGHNVNARSGNNGRSTSRYHGDDNDDDDDDDEENIPQLRSFEPASQGEQFIDVYTTNEYRERVAQLSGQVPIAQPATVGGQLTRTNKSEFQRTHLLKVKGREERNDPSLPRNVFNQVAWTIIAANQDQGIGDSFAVAMLIKRPPGSKGIAEIGLHLPEKAAPIKFDPQGQQKCHHLVLPFPSPAAASPDTVVVDLLTGIMQQLQQLTAGMQQTYGHGTDSERGSMARLRRHREIAGLYERLAELHREEAKEYLSLGERDAAAEFGNA
ncbi:hypothetical protein CEP54_015700 [Fusarium duplospermum]|uniref:Uncharacterized protein n=1 Tax=Fusarium duplospermum TaxID=1325734 RepID=A0A428NM26_9HYPO|nr:hypothetical protein CEP54_015700 [Fusarium duplospermum]